MEMTDTIDKDSIKHPFNIMIRHIKKKDISNVIACNLKWIPEHYDEVFYYLCLTLGEDLCYLAEDIDSGEIIAYNLSVINPAFSLYIPNELEECCGHVVSLVVSPDYRRIGIGRKLMEKPINVLKDIYPEINKVSLHVRSSNDKAIALYKSLGFTEHSTIHDYYGPNDITTPDEGELEDGLLMVLDLKN